MGAIVVLLVILAAICKAIRDTIDFHYDDSLFVKCKNQQWWNPAISWKNKYKEDLKTPKFFGSTTFLVYTTDAWHCFDFLNMILLFIVITINALFFCMVGEGILIGIFLILVYCIEFELVFRALSER